MASIEKRGKTWRYRIQAGIDPQTGRYKQISRSGFPTKRAAQLAAHDAEAKIARGLYVPRTRITFDDFAQDWLRSYASNAKPSSVRIRSHSLSLLSEVFGKLPLQSINGHMYESCLIGLQDSGFSHNTILGVHTVMRMLCKRARQFKLLEVDPTEFVQPPREKHDSIEQVDTVPHYLERDELLRFLDAARQHGLWYDVPLFTTLAYTGMRIGEALALTWQDIDLDVGTISISKTLALPGGKASDFQLLSPKTKSAYRVIPIPPDVVTVLHAWHRDWLADKMLHAARWHREHDFVFCSPTRYGLPSSHSTVQHHIGRIMEHIVPPIAVHVTPHVFRHTHISLLAAAGVPLHEIMERVGQIDSDTTKRVYLHVTKTRKSEAARIFDDYMHNG